MQNENKFIRLLKPRCIVKQLYPGCPFSLHQILSISERGRNILLKGKHNQLILDKNNRFENIFEEIDWWMHREPQEFPDYVKLDWPDAYKKTRASSMVFPVALFHEGDDRGIGENYANVVLRPGDIDSPDDTTSDGRPTKLWALARLLPATEEEYVEDGKRIEELKREKNV